MKRPLIFDTSVERSGTYCFLSNLKDKEWITPLQSIEFEGRLAGSHLYVTIKQQYKNIYIDDAEFLYTFPVPEDSVILDFKAEIGKKRLSTQLEEIKKARSKYLAGLWKGDKTVLMHNSRGNIFQIALGNIESGEDVTIEISYLQEVRNSDGEHKILIPALVPPRYSSISGSNGAQSSAEILENIRYTPVNYRCSYNIILDIGREISDITSPSHGIKKDITGNSAAVILAEENCIPDRDFILSVKTLEIQENRSLYWEKNGEYFAEINFTPMIQEDFFNESREYVFLIDISGSMGGEKILQAKQALKIALRNLEYGELFNIVAFESQMHTFSPVSLPYSDKNLKLASTWIENLEESGGTELLNPIKFSLDGRTDKNFEEIIMLFTDGQVLNEDEIIEYVKERNENIQFHTFGIDTSINTYFLKNLAKVGNGTAEFSYPGEKTDDKIIRQFARINSVCYEDLKIEVAGKILDITSSDLQKVYNFDSRTIYLKSSFPIQSPIKFLSKEGEISSVEKIEKLEDGEILSKIWAKKEIEALEEKIRTLKVNENSSSNIFKKLFSGNPKKNDSEKILNSLKKEMVLISKKYGILSQETAFTGIVSGKKINSEKKKNIFVEIACPVPKGWEVNPLKKSKGLFGGIREFYAMADYSEELFEEDFEYMDFKELDSLGSETENLKTEKSVDFEKDELKKIAQEQNANGSFGENENLILTLKILKRFFFEVNDLTLYRKQLEKSIKYILGRKDELSGNKEAIEIISEILYHKQLKFIAGKNYEEIRKMEKTHDSTGL